MIAKLLACGILLIGPFGARPPQSDYTEACDGCTGAGGSGTSSGGSCGGMVSIQVTVANGRCRWFAGEEPLLFECTATKGCKPSITRLWSGLPAGSELEFCMTVTGQEFCLSPPPTAGATGSGSDTRESASILCGEGGSGTSFALRSPGCALSASAVATCSSCQGDV